MSEPTMNASSMLASAMSGTTSLIFVQLASRLFIFASNQLILRGLSPSILGVAAQLDLLVISISYFSRESIRIAIQRQPLQLPASAAADKCAVPSRDEQERRKNQTISSQSIVNMSYLTIGMGVITATAFTIFYVHFASDEVLRTPHYHASVVLTAIASLIELSSEPIFAVVQQYMLYGKRATIEVGAACLKSLVICGLSIWAVRYDHSLGALPFALGYLFYALAVSCGYLAFAFQHPGDWQFSLLPTRIVSNDGSRYLGDIFPAHLLIVSANVFFQSVVKHLLTQGDAMILAAMTSLQEQGIYSLASNYGGLLARILFQPIEESSRTIFSSLLSKKDGKGHRANVTIAKAHLLGVLKVYMMIAVLIIPLGPSLGPRVIHILGGRRWTAPDVDTLLALYCYYIPFLAFNGIGEAFVSSVANPQELRKQAAWMGLFSACYALAAYIFLSMGGLGAQGLIYANIVNMLVRIIWSFSFVRRYLRQHESSLSLNDFSLQPATYVAGTIAAIVLSEVGSSIRPHGDWALFTLGGGYALQVLFCERELIKVHCAKVYQFLVSEKGSRKGDKKVD